MCHNKPLTPRCPTCHKPAPRHRCHCPSKHTSSHPDTPPTYAAATGTQPPTPAQSRVSIPSRCGRRAYRGYGHQQRRQCHGPIRLLIGLVMRKVQEKKEARGGIARDVERQSEGAGQEEGVLEIWDEKRKDVKGEEEEEKKGGDIEVLERSVSRLSF